MENKVISNPLQKCADFTLPTGDALFKMSFAELEDIAQNHNAEFMSMLKGVVRKAENAKLLGKELANGANFYGKALAIVQRRYQAGVAQKLINANSLSAYVERELGKMPARAYPALKVFGTFCLADEKHARFVPEVVYDELTSRIVNEASKIVNIAEGIKGATPETSGLSHQVFTDTAAILKIHGKTAVEELMSIQARLMEQESDGEKTLTYVSVEEFHRHLAYEAAQDPKGEIYTILKAGGLDTILAVLEIEAQLTSDEETAHKLAKFAAAIYGKVTRFPSARVQEWADQARVEGITESSAPSLQSANPHLLAKMAGATLTLKKR
jgi:hypothetical protein